VLVPLLAGAAVAVSLGAYGAVHDPSGETITTLGFSGVLNMKVWLTTGVATLALVQLATALRLFGHLGSGAAPGWVAPVHRASGTLAVLLSLPVAYHCLWSLGFQDTDTRVLLHSLLGCCFYGAFAAKVTIVNSKGLPGLALPVAGGLLFAVLVGVWLTSALWFIDNGGWPDV
jgi:hypothetical protein